MGKYLSISCSGTAGQFRASYILTRVKVIHFKISTLNLITSAKSRVKRKADTLIYRRPNAADLMRKMLLKQGENLPLVL